MNYYIQTFGCQMNQADTEKINMILIQSWFNNVSNVDSVDLVILNTCSVRKKGEDKVYSLIKDIKKKYKKEGREVFVGITGCMVRKTWISPIFYEQKRKREATKKIENIINENEIFNSDDKIFGRTDKIDFLFRIEDLQYLTKILSILFNKEIWNDEKINEYLRIKQLQSSFWQANIIIQTGCDNYCTYCIVPFTRWREKSRNEVDILEEIKNVVANWTKEIMLLWQNVNSYWKELKSKSWNENELKWQSEGVFRTPFRDLLDKINKIEWIDRIRFTSSNPHDMTTDILEAHFELNKTCNYLHFALQSWNNNILKRMNRRHTYEDFKWQVEFLRSRDPYFSISTDIIVGFPWETEDQFNDTIRAMEEIVFDFAYIARYSERKWTSAANFLKDDIDHHEKARRWHIINGILGKSVKIRAEMMLWKTEEILVSWITKEWLLYGRTRNFKEVIFESRNWVNIGDIIPVKIEKIQWRVLLGKI